MGAAKGRETADALGDDAGRRQQGRGRRRHQDAQLSEAGRSGGCLVLDAAGLIENSLGWPGTSDSDGEFWRDGEMLSDLSGRPVDHATFLADCTAALANTHGDFAGVIFKRQSGAVHLFRDALGGRPLYFRIDEGRLHVGARPQDIAPAGPDYEWLSDWANAVPETDRRTAFKGVYRLLPGERVRVDLSTSSVRAERWWRPRTDPTSRPDGALIEQADSLLDEAVASATGNGKEAIALHLTGGLDSHLVLKTALARHAPDQLLALCGAPSEQADPPLPGEFDDDARRAARTAAKYGIAHKICAAPPRSLVTADLGWSSLAGRPMGSGESIGWTEACLRAARQGGATRLLTGASGNYS